MTRINSDDTILEINLAAIRNNYKILSSHSDSKIAATLKANAYGLGAGKVGAALAEEGCRDFFVASVNEGRALKPYLPAEANIYILNGVFYNSVEELLANNLIPVLNNIEQIEMWQELMQKTAGYLPCVIHFNTGMNRLGINYSEAKKVATLAAGLNIVYIMSHLSSAEQTGNSTNKDQLELFNSIIPWFPDVKKTLSNSSGIFLGSTYHFDLIRAGGAIYGLNPTLLADSPVINPINLSTSIIHINELPKNTAVGYNETYITNKPSIIATIPVGYADGYLRSLSNKGIVYINNQPAPVVGRISMDLTTIDVSNISRQDVFLNQQVEIIGPNSSPDTIAALAGTIGYEILTSLGNRYKRIYI